MSLLKILPNAVDTTLSYTFGNVSATSVTANGVDLITYVQAAYDKANTGVSTSTDQYARDTANAATGVNTTQNTNITAVNTYAASAYGAANTNATNIGYVNTYAASAYGSANTNATNITAVNTYAASAYAASNTNSTNITVIQGVNTSQNTDIATANTKAQAAFDKANTSNNTLVLSSRLVPTTSNSYYFNGSSDVSSPDSTAFNFGTGDFTVECWVYITRAVGVGTDGFFQNKSGDNLNLQRNTSGNLQAWDGSDRISTTAVSSNAWHHVAFCRASGTARIFVDGTLATSWSSTVNYNASRGFALGYTAGGGNRMNGYISNFRVVNGTALYTSTFTPPTSPLTAISGTALLTAKTLSIEDLSTNAFSMTNNGVTTSSSYYPTFGTSSVNVSIQYVSADNAWEFTNDGTTYYRIADSGTANAAFAAANTNATNITVLQGVDATQNTNITAVNTYAASAYGAANTNATNIGYVNTYAASAYALANTVNSGLSANVSLIAGINTTQNNSITTVTTLAQAAFDKANTGSSSSADQYARDTANTASANTIYTQGVDATQNTNITSVNTYATSSYGKANTVGTLAQAAFDKANNATTPSFAITVDTFSGNGSNTSFTLSAVPSTKNETMVHINGVYQNKNTYSVSGSTITFTGVAANTDTIEVETAAGSLMNVAATAYSTRIYTGNGTQNTFTISSGQTANTLFVFNNGICQFPGDDYTVSGTTLTYVVTPQADEVVQIREMPVGRIIPVTVPNMRRYTADGVTTTFTVSSGQTANSMFVYENGVCQVPGNDYSVSGTTLTFVTAPTSDKVIQIREMPV